MSRMMLELDTKKINGIATDCDQSNVELGQKNGVAVDHGLASERSTIV